MRTGIVGLPNAGKSTLFNALTAGSVPAAAYPFTTIDPNIGAVEVPDARLQTIFDLVRPSRAVPAVFELVDIAGLVEGAHRGEGLGNRFLAHIREVNALVHVVRCFEDADVAHPVGSVDPVRDVGTVETELLLADLETLENRIDKVGGQARSGEREARAELDLLERLKSTVESGRPARSIEARAGEKAMRARLFLLTDKPVLYVANVDEADLPAGGRRAAELTAGATPAPVLSLCCHLEAELRGLEAAERREYLTALGVERSGTDRLIRAVYDLLGLLTFFTFNEKEVRAWTLRRGAHAPAAAGLVHTDFEKGFIRAETVAFEDFERAGSWKAARDEGLARSEGKDYVVRDGDILLFRVG